MSICEAYRLSASNARGQHFTMPSMTEDAHILSLEQIMKDYTRGVVHSFGERNPLYDDGDEITEVNQFEDLSDLGDTMYMRDKTPDARKVLKTKNESLEPEVQTEVLSE